MGGVTLNASYVTLNATHVTLVFTGGKGEENRSDSLHFQCSFTLHFLLTLRSCAGLFFCRKKRNSVSNKDSSVSLPGADFLSLS